MLNRIRALVRKEFLQLGRDRMLLAFIVLAPILQLSLLAQATSQGILERPVAILDFDRSSYSRQLIAALENTETLATLSMKADVNDVGALLDRGDFELVVVIPAGFSRQLVTPAASAHVQLIADGANNIVAATLLGTAEGAIARYTRDVASRVSRSAGAPPIDLRISIRYNLSLNARFYTIPAQVGFIMYQVTLAVAAVSLAREREVGTMEQLIIAPLRRVEIILGKALAPLLVGCLDFSPSCSASPH